MLDYVAFQSLEKVLASDLNNIPRVVARGLAEHTASAQSIPSYPAPSDTFQPDRYAYTPTRRTGGLAMTGITAGPPRITLDTGVVTVAAGADTPGAFDSTTRVALQLIPVDVPIPAPPVAEDWAVLECQPLELVEQENRQLQINPTSNDFAPPAPLDKRILRRLGYRIRYGDSTTLPAYDAAWVPLYAFRVPVAGIPLAREIVDLRQPMSVSWRPKAGGGSNSAPVSQRIEVTGDPLDFQISCDLIGLVDGVECWVSGSGIDASTIVESGGVATTPGFWYLYVGGGIYGDGQLPYVGNAYGFRPGQLPTHNCMLVLSQVAPDSERKSSGPISLDGPWGGNTAATGTMLALAVLDSNGAEWRAASIAAGGFQRHTSVSYGPAPWDLAALLTVGLNPPTLITAVSLTFPPGVIETYRVPLMNLRGGDVVNKIRGGATFTDPSTLTFRIVDGNGVTIRTLVVTAVAPGVVEFDDTVVTGDVRVPDFSRPSLEISISGESATVLDDLWISGPSATPGDVGLI